MVLLGMVCGVYFRNKRNQRSDGQSDCMIHGNNCAFRVLLVELPGLWEKRGRAKERMNRNSNAAESMSCLSQSHPLLFAQTSDPPFPLSLTGRHVPVAQLVLSSRLSINLTFSFIRIAPEQTPHQQTASKNPHSTNAGSTYT